MNFELVIMKLPCSKSKEDIYTYPDGAEYGGCYLNGKTDCTGVYRYSNGDVYHGEWKNGAIEGK